MGEEPSLVLRGARVGSVTSLVVKRTFQGCGKELQEAAHREGNPLIFLAERRGEGSLFSVSSQETVPAALVEAVT